MNRTHSRCSSVETLAHSQLASFFEIRLSIVIQGCFTYTLQAKSFIQSEFQYFAI